MWTSGSGRGDLQFSSMYQTQKYIKYEKYNSSKYTQKIRACIGWMPKCQMPIYYTTVMSFLAQWVKPKKKTLTIYYLYLDFNIKKLKFVSYNIFNLTIPLYVLQFFLQFS